MSNHQRAGAALRLDGADDYATVFPGFQLLSEWTLEAWVLPSEPVAVGSCIFGLQTLSARNLLALTSTAGGAWQVYYGATEQPIPSTAWTGSGGQDGAYSASPHHVAITHTVINTFQCRLQLFLNATLHAQWVVDQTTLRRRPEPPLPLLLGACHAPESTGGGRGVRRGRLFAGHAEELRWWGRALPAEAIAASWRWSGPPALWPQTPFGGETGEAAVTARVAALRAQYSFDTLTQRIHDGGSGSLHGWLGTEGDVMDSPQYVESPFHDQLMYGSVYFSLRERSSRVLDLSAWFVRSGIATLSTDIYNGFLVVRGPSQPELGTLLYAPGGSSPLTAGELVPGLALEVHTNASAPHVDFAVRPCAATLEGVVQLEACDGQQLFEVSLSVAPSRAPAAGPVHAVQLARRGALLRLPRPGANATFELWLQLLPPLAPAAALLGLQARAAPARAALILSLRPALGDAVLEVCRAGGAPPARFVVPGVVSSEPQHLAVSFEQYAQTDGTWGYRVAVHRNCVLVLEASVPRPCMSLDSSQLRRPTLGQRYLADEPGARGAARPASGSFAAMRVAEVRLWGRARTTAELCAALHARLAGDEPGLLAYAPVVAADAAHAAMGPPPVALASGFRTAAGGAGAQGGALPAVEVLCAADSEPCPDPTEGVGFVVLPSPLPLPPEVVEFGTESLETLNFPLVAYDPDNNVDDGAALPSGVPANRNMDEVRFEIVTVPDPICGHVYKQGDAFRIPDPETARQYGLPRTTIVNSAGLPLRFVPFEGATLAEVETLQGACDTVLRYRAVDSQGVRSDHVAVVNLLVRRPGLTLRAVEASDPGAVGASRLVRLSFSSNTSEPSADPRDLLQIINGSWGAATLRQQWVDGGSTLLLELGGGPSTSTSLLPGLSRFQVQATMGLLVKGDNRSAPCDSLSPPLQGDFRTATCSPGEVLAFSAGECNACPPGSFWATRDPASASAHPARCRACPGGHFSAHSGALNCSACPPGRYLPGGAADRTACLAAPPGSFVPEPSAPEAEPCLPGAVAEDAGRERCAGCPWHADCGAGAAGAGGLAAALPGHFRAADGGFRRCRAAAACLGGDRCAAGGEGPRLGCYPCRAGWSRGGEALWGRGLCSECAPLPGALGAASAAAAAAALLAFCAARLNVMAARRPACLHPYVLKIGLGHLLMMSCFQALGEQDLGPGFGVAAPALRRTMEVVLAWDGMMPLQAIPLDCLMWYLGVTGIEGMWIQLAVWLLLPCAIMILLLAPPATALVMYQIISRCRRRTDASAADTGSAQLGAVVPVWIPQTGELEGGTPYDPTVVPDGWEAHWSEEHGRHYYHNRESGLSTWHHPVHVPTPSHSQAWRPAKPSGRRGSSARVLSPAEQNSQLMEYRFAGIWRFAAAPSNGWVYLAEFAKDSLGVVLATCVLAYPPVLRQLMALPRCDTFGNERRLLALPEVSCGEAAYVRFAAAAWSSAALCGFGLPGLCCWLAWRSRSRLRSFATRVRIGFLTAEYEPEYYYWDTLVLLCRWAVLAATVLAPSAPYEIRLVLLLGVGNFAAFMNHTYEPFDNLSGGLLDTLESRGLKVFCASAAALLLGSAGVMPGEACAGLVFALLLAHIAFLAGLAWVCLRFSRRSVAEGVVDVHLQHGDEAAQALRRGRCLGALAWAVRERIFLQEVEARRHHAQASYDADANSLVLQPGPAGAGVRQHEQQLLAHGLADCVTHSLAECKLERLSVQFLEYLARQAFALGAERLQCTERVRCRLARAGAGDAPARGWGAAAPAPLGAGGDEAALFSPWTFALGMAAVDLQGALNGIAHYQREQLEGSFHDFMLMKGVDDDHYHLSPRARTLRKALGNKRGLVPALFEEALPGAVPEGLTDAAPSGHS